MYNLKKLKKLYIEETGETDVDIETVEEAYVGAFDSVADFVYELADMCGERIPDWLVVDTDSTWECNLCHDYFYCADDNGQLHFFRYL